MRRILLPLIGALLAAISLTACARDTGPLTPEKIARLPDEQRPKIVALGDSITAGTTVEDSESYPSQLERLLSEQGYPHKVINAGYPNHSTAMVFPRLPDLVAKKPVLVIVGVGYVDIRRDEKNTKENLLRIIKQFQDAGAQVVLTGQESLPSKPIYEEVAAELQIPLIADLRHGLKEVDGLEKDGVHCNAKGCQYMAEHNVLPVILPLLSKELPK